MLLRGANGVGYTNYPDNVVQYFVKQAASGGIDLFRVFDCLNWVENMRVSIDAVREKASSARRRSATPATCSIRTRAKYDLKYYVGLAKELEAAGAHIIGVKDMAGLLKPAAAREAVQGAARGDRPADPFPHPRHVGHCRRRRCWRRSKPASTRSTRRWMRLSATPRSPAWARSSRRCAAPSATRASIRKRSANLVLLGGGAPPVRAPSRATSRGRPRKSICTRCRAGSSPISRSRRARSASRRAGTRSRRPMPTSTRCSATSSR